MGMWSADVKSLNELMNWLLGILYLALRIFNIIMLNAQMYNLCCKHFKTSSTAVAFAAAR